MDLEKVTAKIRPRRGWEAIDLGITLVQNHAKVLYTIWFVITLPIFIILTGALYDNPELMIIIFWLFKPIFERPLLHFFSRELFGEGLTAKQCIKSFFSLAKLQWFMSLTIRRFSFTRSFDLPLIQLEGLKGHARTKRLRVIHSGDAGSAVWLTVVFVLVEMIIYFSAIALVFLMIPEVYLENFDLWKWMTADTDSMIAAHAFNFLMYLGISVVAPFYVACGFALYLNQRTHLEAWDIELAFKRLAGRLEERSENIKVRLANWSAIAFLIITSTMWSPQNVMAVESISRISVVEEEKDSGSKFIQEKKEFEKKKENRKADWKKDLDIDNLSHEEAKKLIDEIKESEDFHQIEKRETNRYRSTYEPDDDEPSDTSISSGWLVFASIFAVLVEFALWIFLAVLVIFLVLKYKHLLVRGVNKTKVPPKRPAKLFGLDLNSETLPDEPWLVAQQMINNNQYREALSLLYRASLIWYIDNSDAIIKEGYTELECLKQIVSVVNNQSRQYMTTLTNKWRELAYAHQKPEIEQLNSLCEQWPKIMNKPSSQEGVE